MKRKSGRNTFHFTADSGNIESTLRTIHSASQLSVYGAVSSWCIDSAETMHGQTSTGVDRSVSEENDQHTKQLDPQEVGSLVRNQTESKQTAADEQLRTVCEEARFTRTVSKGMYYRTGEDVNDGYGNLNASCREYTVPRTHRNSEIKLWIQKVYRDRTNY